MSIGSGKKELHDGVLTVCALCVRGVCLVISGAMWMRWDHMKWLSGEVEYDGEVVFWYGLGWET
jgi:hypothetical protein